MKTPPTVRWMLVLTAVSLFASACGTASTSVKIAESTKKRQTNPTVASNGLQTLVDGNNAFALDIYQALHTGDGNLILSPYSISLALAMTYAGARGQSESQMADVLHFELPQDELHPAFNALDLALEQKPVATDESQEPLQLNIANAVWAEQTFQFLQGYLDTIAVNYGAGVHLADFINQYEPARREINAWVTDQTKNKINDLLPDGSLNSDTRMVLVNAIYFKADWLNQFDKSSTASAPFHLLDGSEVSVDMMNEQMFGIPYVQGDGYQAVELAYAGETAAMDIIVPDEGNFEAFESSFNKEKFDEIISGMNSLSIDLSLPKFKFTKDFSLSATLKAMGMVDAFDPNAADFSGMTGKKDLFISDVIHKAFVAVDEDGTEAAAATGIIVGVTSAMQTDVTLTIDRPFLFFIRDTTNGQILFIGRVLNPAP